MMKSKAEARKYAYDRIVDGKVCFNQLNNTERKEITGLIINSTQETDCYNYIIDADFKMEIPYLLSKFMETHDPEVGKELLELMSNNAIRFAANEIEELLTEQEKEYNFDKQYNFCEA